jgi:hypothetical protein
MQMQHFPNYHAVLCALYLPVSHCSDQQRGAVAEVSDFVVSQLIASPGQSGWLATSRSNILCSPSINTRHANLGATTT